MRYSHTLSQSIRNDNSLLTDQDVQNRNAYPLQIFQAKLRAKKCTICDIYPAKYATPPMVLPLRPTTISPCSRLDG